MSKRRFYITAIPYVNGDPHLGFALECVQTDVLARHRRLRGEEVRFLSGTDDHSLKNVEAAAVAGIPVGEFVDSKAERFAALRDPLDLSHDDFIRTSRDPRHATGLATKESSRSPGQTSQIQSPRPPPSAPPSTRKKCRAVHPWSESESAEHLTGTPAVAQGTRAGRGHVGRRQRGRWTSRRCPMAMTRTWRSSSRSSWMMW